MNKYDVRFIILRLALSLAFNFLALRSCDDVRCLQRHTSQLNN